MELVPDSAVECGPTLPIDVIRAVLLALCKPVHVQHLYLDPEGGFRRVPSLWSLIQVSRQFRDAVDAEAQVLVSTCLRAPPARVLAALNQRNAHRVQSVRLRYSKRHCQICSFIAPSHWLFAELHEPDSLSLRFDASEAHVVLVRARLNEHAAASKLQVAWRRAHGGREKETTANSTLSSAKARCETLERRVALLLAVEGLDFSGPVPSQAVDRIRSVATRKPFPLQWLSSCSRLQVLSMKRTPLNDAHPVRLKTLRFVDISHCNEIGDAGVARFFEERCELVAFKMQYSRVRSPTPFGSNSLEHLDCLGCAYLTDEAVSRVCKTSSLVKLVLAECTSLTEPLLGGDQLEDLSLSCTKITDNALRNLLPTRAPRLNRLCLAMCARVEQPLHAPHAALRDVIVRRCDRVGDAWLEAIIAACPGLQEVDCRGCVALRLPSLNTHGRATHSPLRLDFRGCASLDVPALLSQCKSIPVSVTVDCVSTLEDT